MKIRLYTERSKRLFPIYPLTVSAHFPQCPISISAKFHQIFTIIQGNGMLRLENDVYNLQKGDMFFIPKGIAHEYQGYKDDFVTCFMGFDGDGCSKLFEYFNIPNAGFCMGKITPLIYLQFKEIYKVITSCDEAKLCAKAYSLVVDFFEEALRKEISPLDLVLNYMEENYAKQLTLDDIINVYPYSKSKLCKDFYKENSMTVFEKLTEIRLTHAHFLIENQPGIKIKAIAKQCGYTDVSYFCRMFRRAYGQSPDSIRKNKQDMS